MKSPNNAAHAKPQQKSPPLKRSPLPRERAPSFKPAPPLGAAPASDEEPPSRKRKVSLAAAREKLSETMQPVQLVTREVKAKTQQVAQSFLRKIRENHLERSVRRVPARMRLSANQLELVIELTDDFRSGAYRDVSWGAIAIMTGALLYSVSPADVLPDALMGLGHVDDAVVLSIAMRLVRGELRKYIEFKKYPFDKYFPSGEVPAPSEGVSSTQAA